MTVPLTRSRSFAILILCAVFGSSFSRVASDPLASSSSSVPASCRPRPLSSRSSVSSGRGAGRGEVIRIVSSHARCGQASRRRGRVVRVIHIVRAGSVPISPGVSSNRNERAGRSQSARVGKQASRQVRITWVLVSLVVSWRASRLSSRLSSRAAGRRAGRVSCVRYLIKQAGGGVFLLDVRSRPLPVWRTSVRYMDTVGLSSSLGFSCLFLVN